MLNNMNKKIRIFDFDYLTKAYSLLLWSSKSPVKGNGLEFKSLREYEPWDNVRFIDWLISAREGKPYIKEYEEDKELNVVFLLDVWEYMWFWTEDESKLETMTFVFNTLALSALHKWYAVSSVIFSDKIHKLISPSKSKSVVSKTNSFLVVKNKDSDLENVLGEFNKMNIKKSLVIILTDNDEIKDPKNYKIASQKNDLIYINIFDYFENFLWDKTSFLNLVWEKFSVFTFGQSKEKKYRYVSKRKEKIKNLRRFLLKNRILYLYLDNKRDIFKELLNFLKK